MRCGVQMKQNTERIHSIISHSAVISLFIVTWKRNTPNEGHVQRGTEKKDSNFGIGHDKINNSAEFTSFVFAGILRECLHRARESEDID